MKQTLQNFKNKNFYDSAVALFEKLGIPLNKPTREPIDLSLLGEHKSLEYIEKAYLIGQVDDAIFEGKSLHVNLKDGKYEGLLLFGVTLKKASPTRAELASISRTFNRAFKYLPVVILFSYGDKLSLSSTERLEYKITKEGEKVGKVSILRDISIQNPHSGHIKILEEMKVSSKITTYEELYQFWQKVFDVTILNKSFYEELSNWYFWACKMVQFPNPENDTNNAEINTIRLLTRLMFIWFIKEKHLVNSLFFDTVKLADIIDMEQDSSYYKAILQNLFFATLNAPIEQRAFALDDGFQENKKTYGVKTLYRYESLFKMSKEEVLKLFECTPFLNGGLFECLDKENADNKVIYFDGFTRNKNFQPTVPNKLFFAKEDEADLNDTYNTKNKTYKVRGLLHIRRNEKNERLKLQENFVNMVICKGLSRMSFKKVVKVAQSVKV